MPRRTGFSTTPEGFMPEMSPELNTCPFRAGIDDDLKRPLDFDAAEHDLVRLTQGADFNRREHKLEIDRVRPDISSDVVSPLIHTVVVRTIDAARENGILDYLREEAPRLTSNGLAGQFNPKGFEPDQDADVLVGFLKNPYIDFCRKDLFRFGDTLSDRQRALITRFYSFGSSHDMEMSMMVASQTVFDNAQEIEHRHPELGLRDATNMAEFLRSDFAPSIFRGIASGANGFPDSLRGRNSDPAGEEWRNDPNRAYVIEKGAGRLAVNPEILKAGRQHRIDTATLQRANWPQTGLQEIASRYSIGCPARKLGFNVNNETLEPLGLNLDGNQQSLITQRNPVGTIDQDGLGRVQRDSMRVVCDLLADIIDVVTNTD